MCFNLLDAKWIPIIWANGKPDKVGIRDALLKAGQIREVHAASPLDTVALYRFLMAVLHWCKPDLNQEEIGRSLSGCGFEEFLRKLDENVDRFELLGEKFGFYQERKAWTEVEQRLEEAAKRRRRHGEDKARVGGLRSPTDLLSELPSGSNVAHFRHTRDFREGLCPACCAIGMVRLSAFATHSTHPPYPGGKPSGINGGTPVYVLPTSGTLLHTLLLNRHIPARKGDLPGWMSDSRPNPASIGCLAGFTWRPRRVWLERPKADAPRANCAYCGAEKTLIRRIAFLPGWERPFQKEAWFDDPHLLVHIVDAKSSTGKPTVEPMGLPNPTSAVDVHARNWRRIYRGVLQCFMPDICNGLCTEVAQSRKFLREAAQKEAITVVCSGPAANKALYQDAGRLAMNLPTGPLTGRSAAEAIRELDWLRDIDLRGILRVALPAHAQQRPEILAALAGVAVKGETRLQGHFNQLVKGLASNVPNALDQWRGDAEECLAQTLRKALHIIGKGSALRRQEQEATVRTSLAHAVSAVSAENEN